MPINRGLILDYEKKLMFCAQIADVIAHECEMKQELCGFSAAN